MTQSTEQERAEFEAAIRATMHDAGEDHIAERLERWPDGAYKDRATGYAWWGYQQAARRAPAAPVTQGLREAAQAVVERWDTPLWKDVPATAVYIADLRAALAAAPQPAAQGMNAHGIAQAIRSLPRYSVGKDEKGAMHTFTMQDGPFLRVHEVLAAIDATKPAAQGVDQDAARWRMITLIEREVMMHPDKRSSPEAVGAYMKTVREGFNFEAAIDAALAAQAKQGGA